MTEPAAEPDPTLTHPGTPSTIPSPPGPPQVGEKYPLLSGYELLEVLGQGGMGSVYRARQVGLDRLVAIKMLRAGVWATPGEKARFVTEVKAIARLRHPNIVQIFEVKEAEGQPYFSMEFCGAGTLAGQLKRSLLSPSDAARVVRVLARAVHHAHQQGIIHRDLKPSNVLLTDDSTVKVADFGLAKLTDSEGHTATGALLGTPGYMAPEQARGEGNEAGPATDVWGLGAILYACLTGSPPFPGKSSADAARRVLSDSLVSPRARNPEVPEDLEAICLRCLEKGPHRRYATAKALADDLDRFLTGQPVVARDSAEVRRTDHWVRRNLVAVAMAALLLATAGLIGLAFTLSPRPGTKTPGGNGLPPDETVEALVAAKDLPVGTLLAREELQKLVIPKRLPRHALPPAFVNTFSELADKRLVRAIRAGETFNTLDLAKNTGITLPEGTVAVSMRVRATDTVGGFVVPGVTVDILATVPVGNKFEVFALLVDVMVVAVETRESPPGGEPAVYTISFAVTQQQALIATLAKARGCELQLVLRTPKTPPDPKYDVREVLKILQSIPEPKAEPAPPPRPAGGNP